MWHGEQEQHKMTNAVTGCKRAGISHQCYTSKEAYVTSTAF